MTGFSAHLTHDVTISTLTLSGDVDLASAEKLRTLGTLALTDMIDPGAVLIIDLSDVAMMDSTGIGALVLVNNAARRTGQQVRLRGVPPLLRKVLEIGGLTGYFALEDQELERAQQPVRAVRRLALRD